MKINYKKLILIIIVTILVGGIFAFLTMNNTTYKNLNKPINIPEVVFPIVWVILYILMSISIYLISEDKYINKSKSYLIYIIQLIMNSLWTLFFFGLKWYGFSALWILLLIVVVFIMIYNFLKINKKAGLIQIPYVIWLFFALYLNISIATLN